MATGRLGRWARRTLIGLALSMAAPGLVPAADAATPAGTTIRNVAQVSYRLDGQAAALDSNPVDLRVDELVEMTVEPAPACTAPRNGDDRTVIGFLLTNRGNGHEAFVPEWPTVEGGDFVPETLVADSDHDGCYDPATDIAIPAGGKTAVLAPGESVILFAVGTYRRTMGTIRLQVRSALGKGVTGTVLPGAGDDGSDVVMGATGGVADGPSGAAEPRRAPLVASLVKSQSVRAPDGSDDALRGAIITYRIEGHFTGTGTATDVVIADPIPAGTVYVPGSLTLDDAAVSDGGDGDEGGFDGSAIAVKLGDIAAPAVRTVSFQVQIQ